MKAVVKNRTIMAPIIEVDAAEIMIKRWIKSTIGFIDELIGSAKWREQAKVPRKVCATVSLTANFN
jgi:hypothetical protein